MTHLVGRMLSHYRVVDKIGAGGMGEVYGARDERLDRDVAIKVLPAEVAQDEAKLARFEREAKLLASLSHQNIATLYGLEEHEGRGFLVMELVEGETLAARIKKGPLPIDDALEVARQIAEGLEAAHEHGIIHRDLKPANIMLSPEGKATILDFGLAKMWVADASDADLTHSPTVTAEMTATGVLLGTASYMSPEQARGKRVDKRTDIWAFGCVLYEMLTGRKAVAGEGVSETLAAILKEEPEWTALPTATPPTIRRLLRRCLRKDLDRRLHDVADARIAIDEVGDAGDELFQAVTGIGWSRTTRAAAITAVALLGIIAGILGARALTRPAPQPVMAFHIETLEPLKENFAINTIAVSPDGNHLVYVVADGDEKFLVHRPMDRFEATSIPGTEGAWEPFFSPDSRWVGFRATDRLKKVSLQGGRPIELVEGPATGATWSPAGDEIIFVLDGSLWRVPAVGGEPTIVLQADPGEPGYIRPSFLPDGRALLVEIRTPAPNREPAVGLLDLDTLELQTLVRPGSDPAFARSGHIVFARGFTLYAVAFDSRRRSVIGEPAPVLEGVSAQAGCSIYSFSHGGLLAYAEEAGMWVKDYPCSLLWVDRQGTTTPLTERNDNCEDPRLSPDGSRVAMASKGKIWVFDITTNTWQLLVSEPNRWAHLPVWSPDGERVVFSLQGRRYLPHSIAADFSGRVEKLLDHDYQAHPRSFSPAGDLLIHEAGSIDKSNIMVLPGGGGSPWFAVRTEFDERAPSVSPNGRWLVYSSDRSGAEEVYVEPFPDGGPRVQVSTGGGNEPRWSPTGDELFYRNGAQMIAVPVTTEPGFAITGKREILFESDAFTSDGFRVAYDVDRDGKRFLMVQYAELDEERARINRRLNLILNWFEELERLVPTQ